MHRLLRYKYFSKLYIFSWVSLGYVIANLCKEYPQYVYYHVWHIYVLPNPLINSHDLALRCALIVSCKRFPLTSLIIRRKGTPYQIFRYLMNRYEFCITCIILELNYMCSKVKSRTCDLPKCLRSTYFQINFLPIHQGPSTCRVTKYLSHQQSLLGWRIL